MRPVGGTLRVPAASRTWLHLQQMPQASSPGREPVDGCDHEREDSMKNRHPIAHMALVKAKKR
jgi:hypothetical protein